ncbi:MAG TPA: hypothetical protein VHL53_17005 [Acidimicrobiia bacterium]|nr:hypothetical protein [Acidimicrobiia bacterium]
MRSFTSMSRRVVLGSVIGSLAVMGSLTGVAAAADQPAPPIPNPIQNPAVPVPVPIPLPGGG